MLVLFCQSYFCSYAAVYPSKTHSADVHHSAEWFL